MERFWQKVVKGKSNSCWLWTACTDGIYGSVRIRNRNYKAHRVAFLLGNSVELSGMNANHTCDNPLCCNPQHLWSGTNGDNNRDREGKGRGNQPKGEKHGRSKLTKKQVSKIRQSSLSAKTLAKRYDVHFSTIYRIKNRVLWTI